MVPEQETELLGLLCLLHRHADKIIANEGQNNIVDFIGGGGGGGGVHIYDAYFSQETFQISIASEHGICCRHFQHRLVHPNHEGH